MTIQLAIATFFGAAMFPFLIRMLWGRFVDKFGEIGGFLSALFIVGVMWAVNHGYGLIYQTGAWVDMGTAAGVGLLVASLLTGAKFGTNIQLVTSFAQQLVVSLLVSSLT